MQPEYSVKTIKLAGLGLLLAALGGPLQAGQSPPLMLTGEVFSLQAQELIVPLTSNWSSRISKLVPEGSFVEPGDVVVEFDGTEAARQLEQQREAARTAQAVTERDLARLEKELIQAGFQLDQARVDLELATIKAEVPQGMIGAIEYEENQLALEQATKALENATKGHEDRRKLFAERQTQARLDAEKVALQEQWWAQMLESMVIRAEQPGFIIYGNHPWTRAKFQDGDTVQTSFKVAQVANTEAMAVRVWINGVDRPAVNNGDRVQVMLDALAGRTFAGHIEQLSESGANRPEWGDADYFEAVVVLDESGSGALLPGMSALVEVLP
jgi:multidrug resistance efflux pump